MEFYQAAGDGVALKGTKTITVSKKKFNTYAQMQKVVHLETHSNLFVFCLRYLGFFSCFPTELDCSTHWFFFSTGMRMELRFGVSLK